MKPNLTTMNRKELKAYVLAHREDEEALQAYLSKSREEGNWVKMPPLESVDDLENYPEFIEKIRQNEMRKRKS